MLDFGRKCIKIRTTVTELLQVEGDLDQRSYESILEFLGRNGIRIFGHKHRHRHSPMSFLQEVKHFSVGGGNGIGGAEFVFFLDDTDEVLVFDNVSKCL